MEIRKIKGQKLRAIREQRGFSQDELVRKADHRFTKGALSQWEQENYRPKDELIPILLSALSCEWKEISEVTLEIPA